MQEEPKLLTVRWIVRRTAAADDHGNDVDQGADDDPQGRARHLGLQPGDQLEFLVSAGGYAVLLPRNLEPRDLRGLLPLPETSTTIDEIHEAVIEAATDASGEWSPSTPTFSFAC